MLQVSGNVWTSEEGIGTIRKMKGGVLFFDQNQKPFMFLVNNAYGEQFFVSAGEAEGKIYYMHGLSECDARHAGIHELGYSGKSQLASQIIEELEG